ncbi:MAG TPA: M14 family zinc carboxypeptidase [Candidatus Dormibacteraeota bacterium]|nr:M14 family zinc carboxypeptidase [Candidatus Dormibacteraeota bacterium]
MNQRRKVLSKTLSAARMPGIRACLCALATIALASLSAVDLQAQSAPANNEAYGKKIREFTTEPFFLTDLVDHLPASTTVPSPDKILGHIVGAPDFLTYSKDIYRYYDELAKATPRVKVLRVGKTEEGRDFLLVVVTDESNMAQIDRLREITAKLADPRKISDAEAQQLIAAGKPFYWASGSIHSPETGSPEMLMELAYRLAVEDSPMIQNIRKNAVFLISPIVEVDGHDRMVDSWNYKKANPGKLQPPLVYWGHYVQHDNNRDSLAMGLKLSQVMMQNFLNWHPQVLHDLHESIPYLYVSTGTGPYNAWLDPIVISEWQKFAYNDVQGLTERGVFGVWTHGFYDGWAPNYMFYVANGHNSIGRFYETYGNSFPDTHDAELTPAQTSRTWFRPNPPLPKVKWSLRNNTNLEESGVLLSLDYTAKHGQELLSDFYKKSQRSVAKATTEGPAAWALLNDGRRPALAAQLANLLQKQGAEVQRLEQEFEVKEKPAPKAADGKEDTKADAKADAKSEKSKEGAETKKSGEPKITKIPIGSYIVRMDQPYSRMVDMLLDTQYYSTDDPRPYDDTGWTLGPLRNVKTLRVTDTAILKAPMTLIDTPARFNGGGVAAPHAIKGKSPLVKAYVINASGEPALATLRFRLKDAKFFAAEAGFEAGGEKFVAGSFLLPVEGNPADLDLRLNSAARELGVRVTSADTVPDVARHEVGLPRIALLHTWTDTQNEGWFRLMLEEAAVPYSYISDQTVRGTPNLREKYDVIVLPPGFFGVQQLINGIPKRTAPDGSDAGAPVPWQNSETTPNFAGVDQTPDMRGGLGLEGLANLKRFIEDGGVFIPIGPSTRLPIELGMTDTVTIADTKQLQARGMIARANVVDAASPIAYGYDDSLGVYFNQGPVFRISVAGRLGGFFGDDSGAARPSGRGAKSEPDIPQGRAWDEPEPPVKRSRAEQELYVAPDVRGFFGAILPPASLYPRVVLRFADEKNVWISGMLAGGSELAEAPAVVDVPLGRGHVVLFAINPMWRQETQGTFMLVLNAALNFDHLNAGRKAAAVKSAAAAN